MEPVTILLEQLREIARSGIEILPNIIIAIVVLVAAWAISMGAHAILSRVMKRSHLRPSLKALFSLFASIFVWVFGLMVAAVIVFPNLTPSSILAGRAQRCAYPA